MRGSCSPTSMSTMRVPPKAVRKTTMPGGSAFSSPPTLIQPAALRHVAVAARRLRAGPSDGFERVVLPGEIALFGVARVVTALVYDLADEPGQAQLIVERDHRREAEAALAPGEIAQTIFERADYLGRKVEFCKLVTAHAPG